MTTEPAADKQPTQKQKLSEEMQEGINELQGTSRNYDIGRRDAIEFLLPKVQALESAAEKLAKENEQLKADYEVQVEYAKSCLPDIQRLTKENERLRELFKALLRGHDLDQIQQQARKEGLL